MTTIHRYKSPNGTEIIGTLELVPCRTSIAGIDPDGFPEYDGRSEMFWDDQRPVERDGKIVYLDENGAEWTFDQLIKIEDLDDMDEED